MTSAGTAAGRATGRRARNRELFGREVLAAWARLDAAALTAAAAAAAGVSPDGDVPAAIDRRQRNEVRPGCPMSGTALRLADAWSVANAAGIWAGRDDAPNTMISMWLRLRDGST